MRAAHRTAAVAMACVAGLVAPACGDAGADERGSGRLLVATTVAPITSIVATIAGDLADVEGIVPEGTNSHTFEPVPSVAELLSEADVIYVNGLQLEEPTTELAEQNLKDGAGLVEVGNRVISPEDYVFDFSFPEKDGKPNPHLWTDPTLVKKYAELVRDDLSERDPANAEGYAANHRKLAERIDALDRAMREAFNTIESRKLLTYHDAYAYFAETYDWEIIGAIQVSDFEDPTASEVADLIDQIKAEDVGAIFGSEVFPSPVLEQIGTEADVAYVDELRDDDLPGRSGEPEHSWLGLMRSNSVTMTEALGGDATALKELPLTGLAPDEATYPQ